MRVVMKFRAALTKRFMLETEEDREEGANEYASRVRKISHV